MTMDELFQRLQGVTKNGQGYVAQCPAHDDRKPSLSITEEAGKILLFCHGGCQTQAVLDAVGLDMKDLFLDPQNNGHRPEPLPRTQEPEAVYDYHDGAGRLLFQVCRYPGKRFLQRRPDGSSGWHWNMGNIRRVPYRLPELLKADPETWVFITEGEKDADRLYDLRQIATSNPGGAGKWLDSFGPYFDGRRAAILPDNDEAGRRHATDVAQKLLPFASEVRTVELPGLPEKGDVSDWLDQGHAVAELMELVAQSESFRHSANPTQKVGGGNEDPYRIVWAKDIPSPGGEGLPALWSPFIFPASIHLISGDSGVGKTTFFYSLAISGARGEAFLGIPFARPLRILFLDLETPTLLQRSKLHLISGGNPPEGLAFIGSGVPLPLDLNRIAALVCEHKFDLVVIDPIAMAFGTKVEDDNAEAGREMTQVRAFVKKTGAGVVLVHHLGKQAVGKAVYKGRGASARPAAAEVVLNLEALSEDGLRLETAKNRWVGGKEKLFLRKAGEDTFEVTSVEGDSGVMETQKAQRFIIEYLKQEGEAKRKDILDIGMKDGHPQRTLERALSLLVQVGEVEKVSRGIYSAKAPRVGGNLAESETLSRVGAGGLSAIPPSIYGGNLAETAGPPSARGGPCHICGSEKILTPWGEWLCSRCHPRPD